MIDTTEPTMLEIVAALRGQYDHLAQSVRDALVLLGQHIPAAERAQAYHDALWALRQHGNWRAR